MKNILDWTGSQTECNLDRRSTGWTASSPSVAYRPGNRVLINKFGE